MKHGRGAQSAFEMLDLFESVGATCFDITHTDIDGNKRGFRPRQTLEQTRASVPYLLESSARRRNNFIIRPHGVGVQFVQLDDLDKAAIERARPVSFLTLATSPGNHQSWVAVVPPAGDDVARRLKRGTGADPTASGATRMVGTANFKRKYEPDFPIIAILESTPALTVTSAQLENAGLLAPLSPSRDPVPSPGIAFQGRKGARWPSYQQVLDNAPPAHDGDRPDVSRADFVWSMTAIDWGHGIEETANRLMCESRKALENGEAYAHRTAVRAAEAVGRRSSSRLR